MSVHPFGHILYRRYETETPFLDKGHRCQRMSSQPPFGGGILVVKHPGPFVGGYEAFPLHFHVMKFHHHLVASHLIPRAFVKYLNTTEDGQGIRVPVFLELIFTSGGGAELRSSRLRRESRCTGSNRDQTVNFESIWNESRSSINLEINSGI